MASAIAEQAAGSLLLNPLGFTADYNVTYVGTDVAGGQDSSSVNVSFDFDDTPENMDGKLGTAVRNEGARLGYTVGAVVAAGYRKV